MVKCHVVEAHMTPPMTHKYRGSIVVLSISKSVEPNEEQKEMISGSCKVFSASTEISGNR